MALLMLLPQIFKSNNIDQTVQLVLSVVCANNDDLVIRHAVDLTDLLLDTSQSFLKALAG